MSRRWLASSDPLRTGGTIEALTCGAPLDDIQKSVGVVGRLADGGGGEADHDGVDGGGEEGAEAVERLAAVHVLQEVRGGAHQ
eukprot:8025297-Pyramimonas_sp.AAC.1